MRVNRCETGNDVAVGAAVMSGLRSATFDGRKYA